MSEKSHIPATDGAAEGKVINGSPSGKPAGPEGMAANNADKPENARKAGDLMDMVDQPAKVMRIGTMVKQLLDEVKSAPLDDAARTHLAEIHQASIRELEDGLAPELIEELNRLSLPFTDAGTPSDAELRIAQAQLVGWLEGLFHGMQTALAAQSMANQQTAVRLAMHQLPPGTMIAPGVMVGDNGEPQRAPAGHPGAAGAAGQLGEQERGRPDSGGPGQYL